jgi:hypothetical protein
MAGRLRLGRWIGAVAVLAVALPVVHVHVKNQRLGKRLVDGILEASKDRPRPVVGQPSGTTFEACLGPVLDEAPDAGVFATSVSQVRKDVLLSVLDGTASFGDTGTELHDELDAFLPWVDRVLACGTAPAVGEAPGLGPFAPEGPRTKAASLAGLGVAKAVGLFARRSVGEDVAPALERCVRALAVGRDLALDRSLLGAMLDASMLRSLAAPCGDLLGRASKAQASSFAAGVRVVRAGTPRFDEIIRTDSLQQQLDVSGRDLPDAERARLPPNAAEAIRRSSLLGDSVLTHAANLVVWGDFVARHEAMSRAVMGPARDAELDRLSDEMGRIERFSRSDIGEMSFAPFADRYDAVEASLDWLESVARVRAGEAPLPSVTSAAFDGGLTLSIERVLPGPKRESLSMRVISAP